MIAELRTICLTLKSVGAGSVVIQMSSKEKLDDFAARLREEMDHGGFHVGDASFDISSAMMFNSYGVTLIFTLE